MSDFLKETSGTDKACLTNGLTLITGGANGIADMTLGLPSPGYRAVIRLVSITESKTVVVTSAAKVDGTNNILTFNAAEDCIVLVYKDEDNWAIESNSGVALSA